jgi:uncharacterized delta-60 repeat protein
MNEKKYVQFTVTNKTAQETSATLFNVNQLVDVPQVVTYTTNSAIPSVSSNNLVSSAINPFNGDVFSYSDDVNSVFVYDSSGNLIQTITGIGSAGSGNRNDIIYIRVYNCMVVNTDLGLYIIDCDLYSLTPTTPITTTYYNSSARNVLVYDELTGMLYVSSNDGTGNVYVFNFTTFSGDFLINSFAINNPLDICKATKQEERFSLSTNQNYLQIFDVTTDNQYLNNIIGFDGTTSALAVQSDGKIIIGGFFLNYNGVSASKIIRLNSDGLRDTSFNIGSGFDNTVQAITIQPDGKILIGGLFTSYNGTTANRIIRLNTDGSIDGTFVYGTGFNSDVEQIRVQSNGFIVICGIFSTYKGTSANRIVRLNTVGTIDATFIYGTGFNSRVFDVQIQTDGKIICVGSYTAYKGLAQPKICRLTTTGTLDATFNVGTGVVSGTPISIAIQTDGKIILAGTMLDYNGTTISRIVRINTDGSIDSAFTTNNGTGISNTSYVVKLDVNGKIYVGFAGAFFNGNLSAGLFSLNSDGTFNSSVYIGGFSAGVFDLAFANNDNLLYCVGQFAQYQGYIVNRFVGINVNGNGGQPSLFNMINGNLFGLNNFKRENLFSYNTQYGYFNQNNTFFNPNTGNIFSYTYNTRDDKILVVGSSDSTYFPSLFVLNSSTLKIEKTVSLFNFLPVNQVDLVTSINYVYNENYIIITSYYYIAIINAQNYSLITQIDNVIVGTTYVINSTTYSSESNLLIVNCYLSSGTSSDFYFIDFNNNFSTSPIINIPYQTSYGAYCVLNDCFYFAVNELVYVFSASSKSIVTTIPIIGNVSATKTPTNSILNQPAFSSTNNLIYVGTIFNYQGRINYINPLTNTLIYTDTLIASYLSNVYSIVFDINTNSVFVGGDDLYQQIVQVTCVDPLTQFPTYTPITTINQTYDKTVEYWYSTYGQNVIQRMTSSTLSGYTYISSVTTSSISVFDNTNKLIDTISFNPILTGGNIGNFLFFVESLNYIYILSNGSSSYVISILDCSTNTILTNLTLPAQLCWLSFNTIDNKIYVNSPTQLFVIENNLSSYVSYANPTSVAFSRSRIVFNSQANLMYITLGNVLTSMLVFDCDSMSFGTTITSLVNMGQSLNLTYNTSNNCVYSVGFFTAPIEVFDCSTNTIISQTYLENNSIVFTNDLSVILTNDNQLVFSEFKESISLLTFFDCNTNTVLYSTVVESSSTNLDSNNFCGYVNGLTYSPNNDTITCYMGGSNQTNDFTTKVDQYNYLESLITISKTNTTYNDIVVSYYDLGVNNIIQMNSGSSIYWNQQSSSNPNIYYSLIGSQIENIFYNPLNSYLYGSIQGSSLLYVIDLANSQLITSLNLGLSGSITNLSYNYLDNILGVSASTTAVFPATTSGGFVLVDMQTNTIYQTFSSYGNYGVLFANFNPITNQFSYGGLITTGSSYIAQVNLTSNFVITTSGSTINYNTFVQTLNDSPKITQEFALQIPQSFSVNPLNVKYTDASGNSTFTPYLPNIDIDQYQKSKNRGAVKFDDNYIMSQNTEIVDFVLPPLSSVVLVITYRDFLRSNLLDAVVREDDEKAKYLIEQDLNTGIISAKKYWGGKSMPKKIDLGIFDWKDNLTNRFQNVQIIENDIPRLESGTPQLREMYQDLFGFKKIAKKKFIGITEPPKIFDKKEIKLTSKKKTIKPKAKTKVWLKNISK